MSLTCSSASSSLPMPTEKWRSLADFKTQDLVAARTYLSKTEGLCGPCETHATWQRGVRIMPRGSEA
jgi:hypothetical protein